MEFNFEKIRPFSALTVFQIISCFISGFLFLFIYNKGLFYNMDLFRLSIISIAITSPIFAINATLFHFIFTPDRSKITDETYHKFLETAAYFGTLASLFVIYIPIILGYFLPLTLKGGIIWLLILQAIVAGIMISMKKKEEKK